MKVRSCARCGNCRWACENHSDRPWLDQRACGCRGRSALPDLQLQPKCRGDEGRAAASQTPVACCPVVVPAADGSTDFAVLQNELKGQSTKIVLVAIDLFYLMGVALRRSSKAVDARLRILRRRDRDDVSADRDVAQ